MVSSRGPVRGSTETVAQSGVKAVFRVSVGTEAEGTRGGDEGDESDRIVWVSVEDDVTGSGTVEITAVPGDPGDATEESGVWKRGEGESVALGATSLAIWSGLGMERAAVPGCLSDGASEAGEWWLERGGADTPGARGGHNGGGRACRAGVRRNRSLSDEGSAALEYLSDIAWGVRWKGGGGGELEYL